MAKTTMMVPPVRNPKTAVLYYHTRTLLSDKDVREIFGCSATVSIRLRRAAAEDAAARGIPTWNPHCVSTQEAFATWGIDVEKLERGILRAQKLGLEV